MKEARSILFFLVFFTCGTAVWGQQTGRLVGVVTDSSGAAMTLVNVVVLDGDRNRGTSTDDKGRFELELPANREWIVTFRFIGFSTEDRRIILSPDERRFIRVEMQEGITLVGGAEVRGKAKDNTPMKPLDVSVAQTIPTPSRNFEGLLRTQGLGVSQPSELSSSYSVRGGSYDENLIYVNDIQIYRPFLVRSGQQEGLSFINSDLVGDVSFSSGGFEAKYGDKMSSVLDVKYRKPTEFAGSVSAGLLGGSAHIEDASKNYRFTQMHGVRYLTNSYLLGSLDTDGSYNPVFFDYQGLFTYDLGIKTELEVLANYSRNQYNFIPETRQTDFGTINEALRLTVFFAGEEVDDYETGLGAVALNYNPRKHIHLKFITSAFRTLERETFDIEGAYRLDELERDLSQDDFGDVAFNRGVGGFLNHARNYLEADVWSVEHKGKFTHPEKGYQILWGAKAQHEEIDDELSEWELIDSVGFSIPQTPSDEVVLAEVIKAKNDVISNRLMGYGQFNQDWKDDNGHRYALNGGVRANYWDFNEQLLISPRVNFTYSPYLERRKENIDSSYSGGYLRDWTFRAAFGFYHQPPFYREMRDLNGQVNPNIKAQTSIHYVLGAEHNLRIWGRDFNYIAEVYYKQLRNLVPYEIDNVRLRYYATNNSNGYATGLDMKLGGEFVEGIDSWLNVGILQTEEDLEDDFFMEYFNSDGEKIVFGFTANDSIADSVRVEPGFIPRPTDQRVNIGLFFQDYLPGNENIKMHMNLLYSSGLPFGPPSYQRYQDTLRIPAYRRVDIGGSFQIKGEDQELKPNNPLRHLKSLWVTVEVFNLLQINNTISYLWVTDVTNRQYAIPNYLTARRLNVRLVAKF